MYDLFDYIAVNQEGKKVVYSKGRSLNISEQGLLMETDFKLPKDSQVIISLDLGEGLTEIQGKIVYTSYSDHQYKLGVRFINNSEKLTTRLKSYIKTIGRTSLKKRTVQQT